MRVMFTHRDKVFLLRTRKAPLSRSSWWEPRAESRLVSQVKGFQRSNKEKLRPTQRVGLAEIDPEGRSHLYSTGPEQTRTCCQSQPYGELP
eukprot:2218160-Rhodomonas_salina.1